MIITFIIVNAVLMGIETFDFVTDNVVTDRVFNSIDNAFLSVFTVELILQLIYRGLSLFLDGWLLFDFVIVLTSWSMENLQIIRCVCGFSMPMILLVHRYALSSNAKTYRSLLPSKVRFEYSEQFA
jgi:Ion transport protein